jgi:hypothetical protein
LFLWIFDSRHGVISAKQITVPLFARMWIATLHLPAVLSKAKKYNARNVLLQRTAENGVAHAWTSDMRLLLRQTDAMMCAISHDIALCEKKAAQTAHASSLRVSTALVISAALHAQKAASRRGIPAMRRKTPAAIAEWDACWTT